MSWRRNRSPMTMMSSQNHRTNMNTAKTSVRKLRKVNPSEKKNIAVSPFYWTDSLRASRAACAFFVACERLPIPAGGAVHSYGPNPSCQYKRAAGYVDRIFKGEKPADLPVQAPTKYELVVNLKTTKALGLEIPTAVLTRAER